MGYTVKGPQKCSVCCIQCPWKSVCDGSVSRAAAQVTELSMDAAQSCGLKVVSEHCCAAYDKQLNLSQQQHRMYKHLQNRNYSNTWYLDYPFTTAKRDVLWPLLKSIHTIMQYTSFEYSWKKNQNTGNFRADWWAVTTSHQNPHHRNWLRKTTTNLLLVMRTFIVISLD